MDKVQRHITGCKERENCYLLRRSGIDRLQGQTFRATSGVGTNNGVVEQRLKAERRFVARAPPSDACILHDETIRAVWRVRNP
jgi:hypothetical protein